MVWIIRTNRFLLNYADSSKNIWVNTAWSPLKWVVKMLLSYSEYRRIPRTRGNLPPRKSPELCVLLCVSTLMVSLEEVFAFQRSASYTLKYYVNYTYVKQLVTEARELGLVDKNTGFPHQRTDSDVIMHMAQPAILNSSPRGPKVIFWQLQAQHSYCTQICIHAKQLHTLN